MNPVLVFRHVENEGPGYLAEFLDKHSIPVQLVKIDQGEPVPISLDHVSALVFMGGTMSVNDNLPWIPPVLELIQNAAAMGLPVLGHCLGGQLIARALGASVGANPAQEFGWLPVSTCKSAESPGWLQQLPDTFAAFHWHGETFSLPDGATRILTNPYCANQGFSAGNILALQCHIEMTEKLVTDWIAAAGDTLPTASDSVQTASAMVANLGEQIRQMQQIADIFYSHWIKELV